MIHKSGKQEMALSHFNDSIRGITHFLNHDLALDSAITYAFSEVLLSNSLTLATCPFLLL